MSEFRTVGLYVRFQRQLHEWSLRDLADRADVAAATLSRIERGHDFAFSNLEKIAAAFGMESGDFLVAAGRTQGQLLRSVTASASYLMGDGRYG